jgi:hypothetical protein
LQKIQIKTLSLHKNIFYIMKIYYLLIISTLFLASCIKNELPNNEADIIDCVVADMREGVLDGVTIENSAVKIWINPESEVDTLSPEFILTNGATIEPANGTKRKFADTLQVYTVTSQDGKYHKEYTVSVLKSYVLTQNIFSFEYFEETDSKAHYYNFFEFNETTQKRQYIWSSGNAGFGIVNDDKPASGYPTSSYENGKFGHGVKLTTTSTGPLGALVKMPIAAGNLFLGTFDITKAMSETLKATRFGMASKLGEPTELRFWYKYQRGAEYKDKDGKVLNKTDNPDIYAVMYEPLIKDDGTIERLDGENVKTAPNIIAIADLNPAEITYSDNLETAEYQQFSIPFVKRKNIDAEKLRNGNYFITVVFSSSANGAMFEGAVGSTLLIDEVEIICK